MLNETVRRLLKELTANHIVERKSYDEIPPRVGYSLAEKGGAAVPILQGLCRRSGACRRENSENTMAQCQSCDCH